MCGTALVMGHREGVVAAMQWSAVALRLGGGLVAAYFFGAVGLAVTSAIVTSAMYVALWGVVRARMGLSTHLTLRPHLSLLRSTAG